MLELEHMCLRLYGASTTNALGEFLEFGRRSDARIVTPCNRGASMTNKLRALRREGCFVWPKDSMPNIETLNVDVL